MIDGNEKIVRTKKKPMEQATGRLQQESPRRKAKDVSPDQVSVGLMTDIATKLPHLLKL